MIIQQGSAAFHFMSNLGKASIRFPQVFLGLVAADNQNRAHLSNIKPHRYRGIEDQNEAAATRGRRNKKSLQLCFSAVSG